ncbi:hypothetical protein GJ496_002184 [Pomphorhynchus laevis]|nr:hypothetical protein GJ496_002184 [Pomphorhynchus laevis]
MKVFISIRVFKSTQTRINRRAPRIRHKNYREQPSNDERAMIDTSNCIDQSDDVVLFADELHIYNIKLALTHVAKKLYSNAIDATERNQPTKQFEHAMWKDYIKSNDGHQYRPNLPKRLADALQSLKKRDDVIVVKADKGPTGDRDQLMYTRCSAGDLNMCNIVNSHLADALQSLKKIDDVIVVKADKGPTGDRVEEMRILYRRTLSPRRSTNVYTLLCW